MAEATLNRILEDLEHLDFHELERIGEAVNTRLGSEEARRHALHAALLASGLVRQIKPRRGASAQVRGLVGVDGKPVSETIIEERR